MGTRSFLTVSPKKKEIKTKLIEGNRRSTKNIINLTNFIRKKDTSLKQECIKNIGHNEKITFLIQENKNGLSKPLRDLIPSDTKILCRKWAEAFNYIDDVDDTQKTLINNIYNAYTFVLHRDMFREIEAEREPWICSALDINALENSYKKKDLPKALNR